jgi:hypothetical protein
MSNLIRRLEMKTMTLATATLATAAFLFASGMAFAGSDHFGSENTPAAGSYQTTHAMSGEKSIDMGATRSIGAVEGQSTLPAESGQGVWGH